MHSYIISATNSSHIINTVKGKIWGYIANSVCTVCRREGARGELQIPNIPFVYPWAFGSAIVSTHWSWNKNNGPHPLPRQKKKKKGKGCPWTLQLWHYNKETWQHVTVYDILCNNYKVEKSGWISETASKGSSDKGPIYLGPISNG